MVDHPQPLTAADHVEPCNRRVRAELGGRTVLDTTRALYVWEWPYYPQFYVPASDVDPSALVDEERTHRTSRGTVRRVGLRAGGVERHGAGRRYIASHVDGLLDTIRFDWAALDAWYEEAEQVFVHPRNPYVRVDALRSTRRVRVELEGVLLAESCAPVLVFETGLPRRTYFDRDAVDLARLSPSATITACPYKGVTSAYWSAPTVPDVAWSYAHPTRELAPVAGLIAFYDERVDVTIDGVREPRPQTHFFK